MFVYFIADINLWNMWNAFQRIKHSMSKFVLLGLVISNENEIG